MCVYLYLGTLQSDGDSIVLVVIGHGDVAVVEGLFGTSQVDVDLGDNWRPMTAQARNARRPRTLHATTHQMSRHYES